MGIWKRPSQQTRLLSDANKLPDSGLSSAASDSVRSLEEAIIHRDGEVAACNSQLAALDKLDNLAVAFLALGLPLVVTGITLSESEVFHALYIPVLITAFAYIALWIFVTVFALCMRRGMKRTAASLRSDLIRMKLEYVRLIAAEHQKLYERVNPKRSGVMRLFSCFRHKLGLA